MLVSLYLLTIIYTNTMGLIIINKCSPYIDKEIESRGYTKRTLSDSELLNKIVKTSVLFLIPGYYLKKAIDLTNKEADLDRLIDEKVKSGEMIKTGEEQVGEDIPEVDSIFKKQSALSLENYDVPKFRAVSNTQNKSMYTDMRYPNSDEVDMDFWEEEEVTDLKPLLESENNENVVELKKEPVKEYLDSISEEELISMMKQLETIRRLKKDSEEFLNNSAA